MQSVRDAQYGFMIGTIEVIWAVQKLQQRVNENKSRSISALLT